ncbi:MAG: RNA polymerase sigma factor [Blastocatellia bacterium]
MPETDSQEPENNDVEKLFQDVLPIIPTVVGQVCAKFHHHLDQGEIDRYAHRIEVLLWENGYRVLRSFKRKSSPETWLFTIAKRHIRRWLREREREMSLAEAPPDSLTVQPDHEEWLLAKEREEILLAAESKLTKRERTLLDLLRQGLSIEEIAEEMKIKRRSAAVMKRALIVKLQRIIGLR